MGIDMQRKKRYLKPELTTHGSLKTVTKKYEGGGDSEGDYEPS